MEAKDIKHLEFIYERMKNVHVESPNCDYMIMFREILEKEKRLAIKDFDWSAHLPDGKFECSCHGSDFYANKTE